MDRMKSMIVSLKRENKKLHIKNHILDNEVNEIKTKNVRLTRDINKMEEIMVMSRN